MIVSHDVGFSIKEKKFLNKTDQTFRYQKGTLGLWYTHIAQLNGNVKNYYQKRKLKAR